MATKQWSREALSRLFLSKCEQLDVYARKNVVMLKMDPRRGTLQGMIDRTCAEADVYRELHQSGALQAACRG